MSALAVICAALLGCALTSSAGAEPRPDPQEVHEFYTQCNSSSGVCEYQLTLPFDHARRVLNDTDRVKLHRRVQALEGLVRAMAEERRADRQRLERAEQGIAELAGQVGEAAARANATDAAWRRSAARLNASVERRLRCNPCDRPAPPNACLSDPCLHGGRCVQAGADFRCECGPGRAGRRCEVDLDVCRRLSQLRLCAHGQCVNGTSTPACRCEAGYRGARCETPIDACAAGDRCLNGGRCVNGTTSPACACPEGYEGRRCERRRDRCREVICQNGGRCVNGDADPVCFCPAAFEGAHCERRKDYCHRVVCLNGGHCVNGTTEPSCVCPKGFIGPRCETLHDRCLRVTCLNGGHCVNGTTQAVCVCPKGFTGPRCQYLVDLCSPDPCLRGACVQTGPTRRCECPAGFAGEFCERERSLPRDQQQSGCGGPRYLYDEGEIKSHPEAKDKKSTYPAGLNCTWVLTAKKSKDKVELENKELRLKNIYPYDYVAVYEGEGVNPSKLLAFYTARRPMPKKKCYKTPTITVQMVTFSAVETLHHTYFGFYAKFDYC